MNANPALALTWEQIRANVEAKHSSLPLDVHPAVRDEIDDAHDWYEQRRPGLGRDFLDEVERVLAEIAANPARYGFADGDIREGPLHRFPSAVYYRGTCESNSDTRGLPPVPESSPMAIPCLIQTALFEATSP